MWVDYWGGGGGGKGYVGPPLKLLAGPGPPWPPSSYAYGNIFADLIFLTPAEAEGEGSESVKRMSSVNTLKRHLP